MTTNIENLKLEEIKLNFSFDEENLASYILDFTLEQDIRIKAFEKYFELNSNNAIELMSQLTGMYQFSGTKLLEQYLYRICTHGNISAFLKLEAAQSLLTFEEAIEEINSDDDDDLIQIKKESNTKILEKNQIRRNASYRALDCVCYDLEDLSTPCRIVAVCTLMRSEKYKKSADNYFREIIKDKKIDCDFRYKTILSLEKDTNIIDTKFFLKNAFLDFLRDSENMTMYRILAGQYLLQKKYCNNIEISTIETFLLNFAEDNNLDYDLRADAADTLLNLGTHEIKNKARDIIVLLGRALGTVRTVFDNAQNVHTNEVESSILEALEFLSSIPLLSIGGNLIDFTYVYNEINDLIKSQIPKNEVEGTYNKCDNCKCIVEDKINYCSITCEQQFKKHAKIFISLNRIYMDRALYSKFNNTLLNILLKVWTYLSAHKDKDEMKNRLLQELEEMSGTCSTGFASRLINVISGFGDFNIRISWEDQIVANFTGRLNALARKITNTDSIYSTKKINDVIELWINNNKDIKKSIIKNLNINMPTMKDIINEYLSTNKEEKILACVEDFRDKVFEEMTICSSKFANRQNFLLFFRTSISPIREEMYLEFKDLVSNNDFDMFFRKAIINYEGDF
jgi:hypothetical protein